MFKPKTIYIFAPYFTIIKSSVIANYPSISEDKVVDVINAFDFERVHKRLVKEKSAYYSCVDNHVVRVPSVTEMKDIVFSLVKSIVKNSVSEVRSNCFRLTKNKKGEKIVLSFNYEFAKKMSQNRF